MAKNDRPDIKIPYSGEHLYTDIAILAIVLFMAGAALVAAGAVQPSEQLPSHFDLFGNPDGYISGRQLLRVLLVPVFMALLFPALFSVLRLFPRRFNYPVTITPLNAAKQYQISVDRLYEIKLAMSVLFACMEGAMIYSIFTKHGYYIFACLFPALFWVFWIIAKGFRESVKYR